MTDSAPTADATQDLGPVRAEVTVAAAADKAFRVFTEGFDSWWPRSHHIAEGELDAVEIEPFEGGRWYERSKDGTECVWGAVLAWDPPNRVALSWAIDGEWELDSNHASRIEVTFTPTAKGGTTVVIEHSEFAGHRAAEALRGAVCAEGGWPTLLTGFVGTLASA